MTATLDAPPARRRPHARSLAPASTATYRIGDRVAYRYAEQYGEMHRWLGTVTGSDGRQFTVEWDGRTGPGGRFVHGREPTELRHATSDDETGLTDEARAGAAVLLRDLVAHHPQWPEPIRACLTRRARTLAGEAS